MITRQALKHFLKCPVGEDGESIELAIETVSTLLSVHCTFDFE